MADILGVYLDDHLAGSVVAIELIERTLRLELPIMTRRTLDDVQREIQEDQALLKRLLTERNFSPSRIKMLGAWLAEKAAQIKFAADSDSQLRRLQYLEALSLGIRGKMALWTALRGVPGIDAQVDLSRLRERARDQYERVERERLLAAGAALMEEPQSSRRTP